MVFRLNAVNWKVVSPKMAFRSPVMLWTRPNAYSQCLSTQKWRLQHRTLHNLRSDQVSFSCLCSCLAVSVFDRFKDV